MGRVDGANSEGHRMERKGQGAVEGNGTGSNEKGLGACWVEDVHVERDKVPVCMTGVDQGRRSGRSGALAAPDPCYVWSHLLPFINNNLFNKNDLLEKSGADVPGIPGAATNNKAYYLGVGWMGWVRD